MKKECTRAARITLSLVCLTGMFAGCFQPDHRPDACSTVQALLDGCPSGFTLLTETNTSTNTPTSNSGTALVVTVGDIMTTSDGCFYKGDKMEPTVSTTNLLITVPGYTREYTCSK